MPKGERGLASDLRAAQAKLGAEERSNPRDDLPRGLRADGNTIRVKVLGEHGLVEVSISFLDVQVGVAVPLPEGLSCPVTRLSAAAGLPREPCPAVLRGRRGHQQPDAGGLLVLRGLGRPAADPGPRLPRVRRR